jgi:hypothetical protein
VADLFLEVTVNANFREIHPMCRLALIYTRDELSKLTYKERASLQRLGVRLVRTSPQIRNIIKKDLKVRKKLKTLLRSKYSQLTRA